MIYQLDTSTCVFFLRGKKQIQSKIKQIGRENCCISEVTVLELRFGAENSNDPITGHLAVDKFIAGLTIIPISAALDVYAKEKVRLRRAGTPMNDEFDLIIGATAIENDFILVTDNTKDFVPLAGIALENWMERDTGEG